MKLSKIKLENLDEGRMSLISLGSISGMGIGIFLSMMMSTLLIKTIIGGILLGWGVWGIISQSYLLLKQ